MVSKQSMLFMIVTVIICFIFPIALAVYFRKKEKISILAVAIGASIFVISQMSLRLPLINYLNGSEIFVNAIKSNKIIYIAFLAVTAGIFEEGGRYLGYKYFMRNRLNWKDGIAFGIGHAGIEAMVLVGAPMINNILFSSIINLGSFNLVMEKMPQAQAAALKDSLINTSSYMFLLGGFERIFVIIFQIALSIIVLEGILKNNKKYLIDAVLIHTLVDYLAGFNPNIFITEVIMLAVAVVSFKFLRKSKGRFKEMEVYQENRNLINE